MSDVPQDLVRLDGVCRVFGEEPDRVVAVDDVTLSFGVGELICLQGASGSGKSTLLNLVAGLDLPDSGTVTVDEELVSAMSEDHRADLRLRRVGVVFQDDNLVRELTALENVSLPLLARGLSSREARELSRAALERVGVAAVGARHPDQMSGGQRQRVGIARGLVGDRSILVADEPTGALDSANSADLFALLRELCDNAGAAVLVATHDPLAHDYATRTVTVRDGRMVES
ncbi:ABC transporter ATP-binding protein [Nocardioides endophyticus]|uniref:ABC transporter ATP-binding protein n=1 Tax=Nocardioides endophyticus TaxID=1353775 RepID=A0ABP8ZGB0_9ACTN